MYTITLFSKDYIEEIFQTTSSGLKEKSLNAARMELQGMTPDPINTMLERQPREAALQKRQERKQMSVKDVPPTTPGI